MITISASNGSYVNALDISKEYGDGRNPLVLKSEFIMSLCEQLMGAGEVGAKEKSIIDRCTANIYRKYIRKYEGDPPTLKDLYDDLMRQKEPVAHEIALALELFTTGSLNVFAHQTNIDTRNRIICYDIQDLGENLKPIGLLVMLDSILNRVIRNRQQGRYTHVYIDEIYLFFASPGVGGKSAINNVEATISGDIDTPTAYQRVGTIDGGKNGTIAFAVTPQLEGENQVKIVITYEDSNGNTKERVFEATVEAMAYEPADPGMDDPGMIDPEPASTFPWKYVIIAVVAALIVLLIVLRIRKKKAKQKAEQALWDKWDEEELAEEKQEAAEAAAAESKETAATGAEEQKK